MKITRRSILSGKVRTLEMNVTQEQLNKYYSPEIHLIQDVFPHLTKDEREFIKTGITKEEWDEYFPPEE